MAIKQTQPDLREAALLRLEREEAALREQQRQAAERAAQQAAADFSAQLYAAEGAAAAQLSEHVLPLRAHLAEAAVEAQAACARLWALARQIEDREAGILAALQPFYSRFDPITRRESIAGVRSHAGLPARATSLQLDASGDAERAGRVAAVLLAAGDIQPGGAVFAGSVLRVE